MKNFSFWQKWLVVVSLYHTLFGLLLAFFSQSPFMDVLLNQYFDPVFWPDNQIAVGTLQYKAWSSAVLGAVIASWGLLMAFLAWYPFRSREKWAWYAIAVSVCLWFVVDTACSLYYHVTANAIFNLFTLLLFGLPLLFTRKQFISAQRPELRS